MKTLKYILIFILFVVIGDQLFSRLMDSLYKDTYIGQSGGKINDLLKNYKEVSILAIGNSRCAHHIVPEQLSPNAYNLSHNGMELVFHTGIIDQLINNEQLKIDTILLHVEIFEFFAPLENNSKDIQHLKYYYSTNKWIQGEIAKLSRFESIKYLLSSYKWNGKVMSIVNNNFKSKNAIAPKGGYEPKLATPKDSVNVMLSYNKKNNFNSLIKGKVINPEVQRYLEHIQALCASKKIKLVCFTSPIYNPSYENEDTINAIKEYFKNKGITYLNYQDEFVHNEALQSIWNWKDASHLNNKGALVFTPILRAGLNNL